MIPVWHHSMFDCWSCWRGTLTVGGGGGHLYLYAINANVTSCWYAECIMITWRHYRHIYTVKPVYKRHLNIPDNVSLHHRFFNMGKIGHPLYRRASSYRSVLSCECRLKTDFTVFMYLCMSEDSRQAADFINLARNLVVTKNDLVSKILVVLRWNRLTKDGFLCLRGEE